MRLLGVTLVLGLVARGLVLLVVVVPAFLHPSGAAAIQGSPGGRSGQQV